MVHYCVVEISNMVTPYLFFFIKKNHILIFL